MIPKRGFKSSCKTKFFLLLLFLLVNFPTIKAQDTCGTVFKAGVPLSVVAPYGDISNLELYKRTSTVTLRLAVHIVQYSNGTGGITDEDIIAAKDNLNEAFEQTFIQFYIFKTDEIKSDQYANLEYGYGGEMDELRTINRVPYCINVYFVPEFPGFCGEGSPTSNLYEGEQGIIIKNSCAITSSFPHEMGHYFNLFHTHESDPDRYGKENITRIVSDPCYNAETAGDLLPDTPADPGLFNGGVYNLVDNSCTYQARNIKSDLCQRNDYSPDTHNLMSYSRNMCRTYFTDQQKERMNYTLTELRSNLINYLGVTLTNLIDQTNAGGFLDLNGSPYASGEPGFVLTGTHTVATENERFSDFQGSGITYKHNNWNDVNSDYHLSRSLDINMDVVQNSNFLSLNYSKIKVMLEGNLIPNQGSAYFHDPWYVLSDGSQPGNHWIHFISEYEPTGNENATEKGVFLDQTPDPNDPNKPYYKLWAPWEQLINLDSPIGIRKFYLQNWTATGADLETFGQDANVVFTNGNAVVQANYKGHLLASDQNGVSSGSQRKLVRTDNGIYHLVYESMGWAWYTQSLTTDFYGQWRDEIPLGGKNPSIAYSGNNIKIVYEDTYDAQNAIIYLLEASPDGNNLYEPGITEPYNLTYPVSYYGSAKPVVSENNGLILPRNKF